MAREESLLISEELFHALSPVSGDLDWEYVWSIILATQDKEIQPILGQCLYEQIMAMIKDGTIDDAGNEKYKVLVEDYIARTVVWFTCWQGLPFWGIKVVNSGVVQRLVDDGNPISMNDIDKVRELCRGQAEWYKQRLIDYLCCNNFECACNCGDVKREKSNYSGGLNLETYTKRTSRNGLDGWL